MSLTKAVIDEQVDGIHKKKEQVGLCSDPKYLEEKFL
jgi:hypothetical protein